MNRLLILIKPVSGNCNLCCRYCFYTDVAQLRKQQNKGAMSLQTLEKMIYNALSESTELCVFGFQGGEPTLAGLDFYRECIRLEQKYNKNHVLIRHSLQTNGILLDDEWCAFLAENKFLTGLSIDGPKFPHDMLRVDRNEKGTHSRSLKAARLLVKHKAEFNILTVVTRQLAAHPIKVYQYYKKMNFQYLQFIPCIERFDEKDDTSVYSLDSKSYGDFLCCLFDQWYEDYLRGDYCSIRNFDNFIYILAGYPPENCASSGICSASPVVEADGSVYPCDFYAIDSYCLGNIETLSFTEMLSGGISDVFVAPSRFRHPKCSACSYYFICRGGCRREREPAVDGQVGLNKFCAAYMRFFQHAQPRMAKIAHGLRHTRL